MKTKLLKKIRKRFSIVHYPNGMLHHDTVFHAEKGVVFLHDYIGGFFDSIQKEYSLKHYTIEHATQLAKERILEYCRDNYSSKAKQKAVNNKYKGIKLWHNG